MRFIVSSNKVFVCPILLSTSRAASASWKRPGNASWERRTSVRHTWVLIFQLYASWERRTLVRHVYLFHKKQRHASLKADFLCLFSIFSLCTLWTLCETCVFSFKTFHIKAWRSPINTRHLTKRYRSQEDCLQEGISLTCPF